MSDDHTSRVQFWIDRLRAGDPSARDHLVSDTGRRLRGLARLMLRGYPRVRRWEDTDDVFQNAAVRLWNALRDVAPASARDFFRLAALQVRRELIDLAHHYYGPHGQGANHASAAGARGPWPAPEPADGGDAPDRLLFWSEFHHQAGALPEREREVFDLLWYQGLTQPEAAAVLGVSDREVRRRWCAARRLLRQALPDELLDSRGAVGEAGPHAGRHVDR